MGQLLKMQDFVSRYETDLIRYTNQFIRLKKQQWEKFRENWENGPEEEEEAPAQEESRQVLSRMKHWLKRKDTAEIEEPDAPVFHAPPGELDFAPQLAFLPETEDQLKKLFLDQLFRFQLKWASSTLLQQSEIPAVLYFDPDLKYFLQRFPDTFLLMYRPVFFIQKSRFGNGTSFDFANGGMVYCLCGKRKGCRLFRVERPFLEEADSRERRKYFKSGHCPRADGKNRAQHSETA